MVIRSCIHRAHWASQATLYQHLIHSLMQRKIQEAEDAKKRLAALKVRAAKRTAATAGAGKEPSGSISSFSGSVSRTGSTPMATVSAVGGSGSDGHAAIKDGNPLARESEPGAEPFVVPSRDVSESGAAGVIQFDTLSLV